MGFLPLHRGLAGLRPDALSDPDRRPRERDRRNRRDGQRRAIHLHTGQL